MSRSYPCVFTSGELAKHLKCSRRYINKCHDEGQLKGYRLPGGNHDRRFEVQAALEFALREGLPTECLERLAGEHGVLPLRCPSLLIVSPTVDYVLPLLREKFDTTPADSSLRAGLILGRRSFDVVLIDAALGTAATRECLELLCERAPETYLAVLASEDDPDIVRWSQYGALSAWQKPCDWQRIARELWGCLRDRQPAPPKSLTPPRRAAA